MDETKTLGIVGCLRKASDNHATLKAAQKLAPPAAVLEFKRRILAAACVGYRTDANFQSP